MFRRLSGYKTQYHHLTLYVASDFDEWRVLVTAPGCTIHGSRQFNETKAKEHACAIAKSFVREEQHEDLPDIPQPEWTTLAPDEWMNWRS
jgi:hypothetical protein